MQMEKVMTELKVIAHANPTAEAVFTALALKERSRAATDLQRFRLNYLEKQGFKVDEAQYVQVFEALHKLGLGKVERSSRGNARRFNWIYTSKSIGQAGLEGTVQPVRQVLITTKAQKANNLIQAIRDRREQANGGAKPQAPVQHAKKAEFRETVIIMPMPSGKIIRLTTTDVLDDSEWRSVSDAVKKLA
jgi:hypothetical protein